MEFGCQRELLLLLLFIVHKGTVKNANKCRPSNYRKSNIEVNTKIEVKSIQESIRAASTSRYMQLCRISQLNLEKLDMT